MATLAQVVEGLTHQVRQLALILDEVREDLVWAVRNDKFHAAGHSQQYVASYTAAGERSAGMDAEESHHEPPPKPHPTPPLAGKTTLFD